VVQIVGPRKSGKTTLLQELIKELNKLGVKPKVVKQTKHALEETDAGDTKRALEAGAEEVYLVCRNGFRVQKKGKVGLEELVSSLSGLIIVEGGKGVKRRDWLSVVTWRNEAERKAYWKPLTVSEMGPQDDAKLVAWKVARLILSNWRARLS